jgi:phage/conjugal plasmid C-4 type zinc finger TraR family protein
MVREGIESVQHSNIEEAEMGQLQALHLNFNAIDAVRARLKHGPSATECADCGEDIPENRRLAVQGCDTCIYCQTLKEKR